MNDPRFPRDFLVELNRPEGDDNRGIYAVAWVFAAIAVLGIAAHVYAASCASCGGW